MFVERHLKLDSDKKHGEVDLRVLNGKVWPARYLIRIAANGTPKFELTGGWKPFVKDNNLKVDDVCIFELVLETKLTFEVHIFRETENSNCSTSQSRICIHCSASQVVKQFNKFILLSVAEASKMKEATQGQRKEMKVTTSGKQIITTTKVRTIDRERSLKNCNPSFHVKHPSYVDTPLHLVSCNKRFSL